MAELFTVAYPELDSRAEAFVEAYRSSHAGSERPLIRSHFTLVFGCDSIPLADYTAHVREIAERSEAIGFACRKAEVLAGRGAREWHVCLVPDEGHAELVSLHDRLCSGILAPCFWPKVEYVPHITMAEAVAWANAERLRAELAAGGLDIGGTISSLRVGSLEGTLFVHHAEFELGRRSDDRR